MNKDLFNYMVQTPYGEGVVNEYYDIDTVIVTVEGKNHKVLIKDVRIVYARPITEA